MTDKEFDDHIRQQLDNFRPNYDPGSWDALERRVDQSPDTDDAEFDDAVRAALSGLAMTGETPDWDAMEKLLAEDEVNQFDADVKQSVGNYQEPYNPASWPALDEKIDEDNALRRRLRVAKLLEIAAVLIAIFTLVNVLPDLSEALRNSRQTTDQQKAALLENQQTTQTNDAESTQSHQASVDSKAGEALPRFNTEKEQTAPQTTADINRDAISNSPGLSTTRPGIDPIAFLPSTAVAIDQSDLLGNAVSCGDITPNLTDAEFETMAMVPSIEMPASIEVSNLYTGLPNPQLTRSRKAIRLSVGMSLDLNALYMPSEQFYANGRKIKFYEKNLLATGFSTGLGVMFDHTKWSFELGLNYSSKTFSPNRVLQIGRTFDVRTVDFDRIDLHVISLPMQAYWRFDRKGKTRFYALAGTRINVIGSANYDLITRSSARSAPPGGGNRTDFEVQQVREHLLDGAEFRTKSYVTVHAGFGVEHQITNVISLFAQPTYNYQVPFFHISDHAGKHLQFASLQLGSRFLLK